MTTKIVKLLAAFGLFLFSLSAYAQPTFVVQNIKGSCEGFNNGSMEVIVTSGVEPVTVFLIGPPNLGPFTATIGEPLVL